MRSNSYKTDPLSEGNPKHVDVWNEMKHRPLLLVMICLRRNLDISVVLTARSLLPPFIRLIWECIWRVVLVLMDALLSRWIRKEE